MMGRKHAALAAALLLALLIFLSGCAGSRYMACCPKAEIYDLTKAPPTVFASPTCTIKDMSGITHTLSCDPLSIFKGALNCTDGSLCSSITNEGTCNQKSNCRWSDGSTPDAPVAGSTGCYPTGSSPKAYDAYPICADAAPASCVNGRCTAMMCGYTDFKPSVPLASQDWDTGTSDPSAVTSQSELTNLPSINLQGTACMFSPMNQKLYNQVKQSRGQLWVNSFRFGVGASFSDFEQARNFFPATDLLCTSSPIGTKDRFTTYVNRPAGYCPEIMGVKTFYHCPLSNINTTDAAACNRLCGPAGTSNCVAGSDAHQFECAGTGFTYAAQSDCYSKCSTLPNPNACTTGNDSAHGGAYFLNGDGRYQMKYMSDYFVDTWAAYGDTAFDETCKWKAGIPGATWFDDWDEGDAHCGDFVPFGWPDRNKDQQAADGPWRWAYQPVGVTSPTTNLLGYFEDRKYATVDFDYEYYAKLLKTQYDAQNNPDRQYDFECSGSLDCISGNCDTTHYKRALCDATTPSGYAYCQCRVNNDPGNRYLTCDRENGITIYQQTGLYGGADPQVESTHMQLLDRDGFDPADGANKQGYTYYVASDGAGNPPYYFFDKCAIAETQKKTMCIYTMDPGGSGNGDKFVIRDPDPATGCSDSGDPALVNGESHLFYKYTVDFRAMPASNAVWGKCKVDDKTTRPYMKITTMGWCAGCTYATMVNQKITWGATQIPYAKSLMCYEWHGEFGYSVASGADNSKIRDADGDGMADASVSWVRKGKSGEQYNGNIEMYVNDGDVTGYTCNDNWQGSGSWWGKTNVNQYFSGFGSGFSVSLKPMPFPSAPYLQQKLTSYLQSNIMPVLDVQSETTAAYQSGVKTVASPQCFATSAPKSVCRKNAPVLLKDLQFYGQSWGCSIACGLGTCSGATPLRACYDSATKKITKYCDPMAGCGSMNPCPGGSTETTYTQYYQCNTQPDTASYDEAACDAACTASGTEPTYATVYNPSEVCTNYDGDGAVIYAIGNMSVLEDTSVRGTAGADDVVSKTYVASVGKEAGILNYLRGSSPTPSLDLNGAEEITWRALYLKSACKTPPMAGLDIGSDDNAASADFVGTPADPLNENDPGRGALHKFFFSNREWASSPGMPQYSWKVANGQPDVYPGKIDLFLQTWTPMCNKGGATELEKVQNEFDARIAFSRALLGNFSRPSLVWKFHFPDSTQCNKALFLDYMFNSTGNMVDAGLIGLMYDSWMTDSGKGWGAPTKVYDGSGMPLDTGLSDTVATGALDNPNLDAGGPGAGIGGKETSAFCALQNYSRRVLGMVKYTYGQKVTSQEGDCTCSECDDSARLSGLCDITKKVGSEFAQDYCSDGALCTMPAGETDRSKFYCPRTCVRKDACIGNQCSASAASSFCLVTDTGASPHGETRLYSAIDDANWYFLAGLPPADKCCLAETNPNNPGAVTYYTYESRSGSKQVSQFLQFPRRGEVGIDCGRTLDTSVLTYCNIRIPISQMEVMCYKT
ncbi:Uncharacterised protein [uncultured archaeon]|nr:Uncharacterised protein [uncultured archaeon]